MKCFGSDLHFILETSVSFWFLWNTTTNCKKKTTRMRHWAGGVVISNPNQVFSKNDVIFIGDSMENRHITFYLLNILCQLKTELTMSLPYLLCDVLLVLSPHTHYMYINFIHIITLKQQQQQQKPHMYEELKKIS